MLNVIKYGKDMPKEPRIGVDLEKLVINNISLLVMKEGGRSRVRVLQRIYYRGASGIIYVIDSTDRERIDDVRDELHYLSNEEELRNKSFLIFANKQDLPDAMTLNEMQDKLNLTKLDGIVKWHLQSACAIRNEGLSEGFNWFINSMMEKVDPVKPIVETVDDLTTMKNHLMSIWSMVNLKILHSKFASIL